MSRVTVGLGDLKAACLLGDGWCCVHTCLLDLRCPGTDDYRLLDSGGAGSTGQRLIA